MSNEFAFEIPISLLKYLERYYFEYGIFDEIQITAKITNTDGTFSLISEPASDAFYTIDAGSVLSPGRHILERMWPEISNWFVIDYMKEISELIPKMFDGTCTNELIDAAIDRFVTACNSRIQPLFIKTIQDGNTLDNMIGTSGTNDLLNFANLIKFVKKFNN